MTIEHDYRRDDVEARMRLAQRVGYLEGSLRMIAELPPGSRGAYQKFSKAHEIAKRALANEQITTGESDDRN